LITEALDSVKAQTYRPIEIVVVDDGSTDNTADVIQQWAKTNEEPGLILKYVYQNNAGASAARNKGITEISGEYVQYLDSDDRLHPERLAILAKTFEETGADFIQTGFDAFDAETGKIIEVHYGRLKNDLISQALMGVLWANTLRSAFRHSLIDKIGNWNTAMTCFEDYEYVIRALIASQKNVAIRAILASARRGGGTRVSDLLRTYTGRSFRIQCEELVAKLGRQHTDSLSVAVKREFVVRIYNLGVRSYASGWSDLGLKCGDVVKQISPVPFDLRCWVWYLLWMLGMWGGRLYNLWISSAEKFKNFKNNSFRTTNAATSSLRLTIKRVKGFCGKGGLSYVTWSGFFNTFQWHTLNALKSNDGKRIFWIGPFSPIHSNVGDHAQTLGVWNFLQDTFGDYKVIRLYRDDITPKKLSQITASLRASDLIFLHSSGDFGSLHDIPSHHPGRISFPEVRRQIVANACTAKVINLPVTAYYEDNAKGAESLRKDRAVFNDSNYVILCREPVSHKTLQERLTCKSLFFPDFVFYLKPNPGAFTRSGVQVILRDDKEALLSKDQRMELADRLKPFYSRVIVNDIMRENFVIPDFILDNYIQRMMQTYQQRELIVTDKMHGMIMAVITHTPCIALSGGIPHKIKAYQAFLSAAVEFIDRVEEIEEAVQRIRQREYVPVDLSNYFERFRAEIAGV
jgi:pyruvyl transferase EpsI